ncbi:hypothetical protein phiPLPE_74 [Iodobacter phage PhiPLPE]|uniref:Uncharacterized protein n=1 Tax=Iodobacter phage PhiPLPE TaxID=551895 RepID=B5AX93_9CAUD|nr:hypothetical protein phiPLPE_74 [Iodobacter phage PhiPLPE]ACG60396.1 hypothetical protein phiPLPE_74 [Iodobacter phage PhiPLPE]
MSILFKKVRIKPSHPHYGGVTGTVSAPAIGGRWCVSMLDGEKRYALGLRITACAVMESDEFEVIA